jgi:hypothetical protein
MEDSMVQDKKNFSSGNKPTAGMSKNLDSKKGQPHTADRDTARQGPMKDQGLSKDKDIASKRDAGSRKKL